MTTTETLNLVITGASAFFGALAAIGGIGFWLATKFNNIYKRMSEEFKNVTKAMADHELKDVERFSELKMEIRDAQIQAQTLEAVKRH